jgi:hypothetical protein
MQFFLEVLIGGLLSGVMYALVALGFVLIYKASGVFNFAQGAMVFFAALTFVGRCGWSTGGGLPVVAGLPLTLVAMVVLGSLTERIVLRPLVNQPQITLFMATIGLTFFIEGLAQRSGAPTCAAWTSASRTSRIEWLLDNANIGHLQVRPRSPPASRRAGALLAMFFQDQDRPGAARGRRRPPGGAVDRHPAAAHLGHRLGRGRLRGAGGRPALGRAQRRAVRPDLRRAEGAAGADPRRLQSCPAPSSAA